MSRVPQVPQVPQGQSLPTLPPYPDEPFSLFSIECAQCAVVLGPFESADLDYLGQELGDMSLAYIQAIQSFLAKKMLMPQDVINKAGIMETCVSNDKKLCVKFASREGAMALNAYKKNLQPGLICKDLIPSSLREREDVLIQNGNKVRADSVRGQPAPKTRRVWQNSMRVLQVKEYLARSYRKILGTCDVGRYVPEAELRMLTPSFVSATP